MASGYHQQEDCLPLAAVAVAASLARRGTWGWAAAISGGLVERGTVTAASLAEADTLIAGRLAAALPARLEQLVVVPYRYRQGRSRAFTRPWQASPSVDLLPACWRLRSDRVIEPHGTPIPSEAVRDMQSAASQALPVVPVHPAMRYVDVSRRGGQAVSPWTVACDGSVVREGSSVAAAWSFVTGAGWADWDIYGGSSSTATEFAAYARALAVYPAAAPVVLITDSKHGAKYLRLLQDVGAEAGKKVFGNLSSMSVFSATAFHVRRLRLTVEWVPRNTHPAQAAADQLARRAARSLDPGRMPSGPRARLQ
jgi:ribonuclease HI